MGIRDGREEQGMGLPFLLILSPLLLQVALDRRQPLPADRIGLDTAALLCHRQNPPIKVYMESMQNRGRLSRDFEFFTAPHPKTRMPIPERLF